MNMVLIVLVVSWGECNVFFFKSVIFQIMVCTRCVDLDCLSADSLVLA